MSRRLKQAQDRAAICVKAMEAILATAEKESRDLTTQEEDSYLKYEEEIAGLQASIAREKQLQEWERGLSPVAGEPAPEESKQVKKFSSLGQQLKAVIDRATRGTFDERLAPMASTGQNSADDTLGGFMVQTDVSMDLMKRMYEEAPLASRCQRRQVGPNFNSISLPYIDETSRATGSRWGGIRAYRVNEGGTFTASTFKIARQKLELEKLGGLIYLTDELMADSVALESHIRESFPMEMAFKLDDEILNGTGAGQCEGILNAAATVSVSKETGQAAATIVYQNIVKMWARMWAKSRANAVWLINQDVEPQLNAMSLTVGTGGVPVYLPAGGLSASPYSTLMGRPVIPVEQCATLGTVGDIILADLSQYMLVEKGGVDIASSIHVQFLTHETALRFVMRNNGAPLWRSALTPFKGTNTLSPFVTLATRS